MAEIFTVFGATGNQGGSVVRYVQDHPVLSKQYKIRAVTRDPSKESGKKLAAAGAEVVKGDINDAQSITSAVQGASVVFGVTNFWETMSKETEVKQGKAIADASKAAGVKHLIFSTLVNVTTSSNGALKHVEHFDGKADIEDYIRTLGINATFYQPAAFMSNFVGMFKQNKSDEGYALALPIGEQGLVPLIDISETGKWVAGILLAGEKMYGKRVAAATHFYTGQQMADAVTKATGQSAKFNAVPAETFKGFLPDNIKNEMTEMFLFMKDPGYFGADSQAKVKEGHQIMEGKPTSFEDYARANF